VDIHNNVFAGIVKKGPSGLGLDFSIKQRNNDKLYEELGALLINVCRNIPNGVLVVFSSYSLMNKCKCVWS
jgi:Rad3-related DNA helicase